MNKSGVKSSNLYEELLALKIDIDYANVEAVLGDKTALSSRLDDIQDNNTFVLRYYNCIFKESSYNYSFSNKSTNNASMGYK